MQAVGPHFAEISSAAEGVQAQSAQGTSAQQQGEKADHARMLAAVTSKQLLLNQWQYKHEVWDVAEAVVYHITASMLWGMQGMPGWYVMGCAFDAQTV